MLRPWWICLTALPLCLAWGCAHTSPRGETPVLAPSVRRAGPVSLPSPEGKLGQAPGAQAQASPDDRTLAELVRQRDQLKKELLQSVDVLGRKPNHPRVVRAQADLAAVEEQLARMDAVAKLTAQQAELEAEIERLVGQRGLSEDDPQVIEARAALAETQTLLVTFDPVARLEAERQELVKQLNDHQFTYFRTNHHPEVIKARARLASVERELERLRQSGPREVVAGQ